VKFKNRNVVEYDWKAGLGIGIGIGIEIECVFLKKIENRNRFFF
jgi:hypothetical protein